MRRTLRCAKCGQKLTGGWTFKKGKKYAAYYWCRKCKKVKARAEDVNAAWTKALDGLRLDPKIGDRTLKRIIKNLSGQENKLATEKETAEKELQRLQQKRKRMVDLLTEGVITRDDYVRGIDELSKQSFEFESAVNASTIRKFDVSAEMNLAVKIIVEPAQWWCKAALEKKLRLQALLFPTGASFDGRNVLLNSLSPFAAILLRPHSEGLFKTGGAIYGIVELLRKLAALAA